MTQLSALRLYFPQSAKAKPARFWQRLVAPSLATYLLRHAHRAGIRQAVLHKVFAGYLPGGQVQHYASDTPPARLPNCLELIDEEARLQAFLCAHADHLAEVRAVLHPCASLF
ncbi:uncharacterized protein DUF190 [Crenobacter luteus]|uniref:Uncharacterized protein n=1 Tax=Crenobacter luteus TaxID=1452487 RepID=A0A161SBX1_9NEIS|nr:DUF190 domain-containing protein [Crenobacter luteus]KZE33553.1 hypothetical protein AVW16_08435 [Crenobacter luteus]TCP13010.1 uncharacterized protein DUF190 [Crenobacter luteus]